MARWGDVGQNLFDLLGSTVDAKCIKRLSANMNRSGVVTATLEIMGAPDQVLSQFSGLPDDIRITSVTQSGAITSISLMDTSQDVSKLRVQQSAIFKTITTDVFLLYTSGIMTTDIVPGNMAPEAEVYIKYCDDLFEAKGWRVSDIFNQLGLSVQFPSVWDYYVTELTVTSGLPVITLIQNLFPFPSLVVSRVDNTLYISSPGHESPTLVSEFTSNQGVSGGVVECHTTSVTRADKSLLVRVEGDMGEMRYIRCSSETQIYGSSGADVWSPFAINQGQRLCYGCGLTEVGGDDDFVVQCNALGGIFAIKKVVYTEDQASIPTDVWGM